MGEQPPPADPANSGQSAQAEFDDLVARARKFAASDGVFTEEEKLILEQVTTLLQKLNVSRVKAQQQAISGGKMSSAVAGAAYGGGY